MRARLLLTLVAAAGWLSCANRPSATIARLSGTHDLVLVANQVFVTSTDRSELRVLALGDDPDVPKLFVPAPNPLEPLSVPVLPRPTGLARDLRYDSAIDAEGATVPEAIEVSGPYVYAISAGAAAISVVDSDKLIEVMRLPAPNPVTAAAGVGAAAGPSTLYYATFDGRSGSLWAAEVPPPDQIAAAAVEAVQGSARFVAKFGDASITSVLPLPGPRVVVSTRSTQGSTGKTLMLGADGAILQELPFPYPVRFLATHAAAAGRRPGDMVFGILDEESCEGGGECIGILAVDTVNKRVGLDPSGNPMLPLRLDDTLPRGLSLATGQVITLSGFEVEPAVLGLATGSNGRLYFFEASNLRALDTDSEAPLAVITSALDTTLGFGLLPDTLVLTEGRVASQTLLLTYQGEVPAVSRVPSSDLDGQRFPLEPFALGRVEVGDVVQLRLADDALCTRLDENALPVPVDLPVTSKDAGAIYTSTPIPPECVGRSSFTVIAGGPRPYTVLSDLEGYLGRLGPGETFRLDRPAYYRPNEFDPHAPAISFAMGPNDPEVKRGSTYEIAIDSHFNNFSVALVDPSITACSTHLPGSVVQAPEYQRAYIAYPSANGIVELSPKDTTTDPDRKIVCYR